MKVSPKRAQVLVVPGCPHMQLALDRVRAAFKTLRFPARVEVVLVTSESDAVRLRFLGSPTVRIDGVDVDPNASGSAEFGMRCRLYHVDGQADGSPSTDWIVAALRGDAVRRNA